MAYSQAATRIALVAIVSVFLIALSPTSAWSVDAPAAAEEQVSYPSELSEIPAPEVDDPISEAEMQDLQTIASDLGMTLKEAIARFAWNDNFSLAVDQIRARYLEHFSGAAIVGASEAWVAFSGDTPLGAQEFIDRFADSMPGSSVTVKVVEGRGFTEFDLEQGVQSVHYELMNDQSVASVSSGYDIATGVITSVVMLAEGADDSVVASLAKAAHHNLPAGISVVVSRSDVGRLGHAEAGADFHYGGETISGCTSGFAVISPTGVRRIATAGHCNDAQTDDGDALPFFWDYEGSLGDFQLNNGTEPIRDDFYSGNDSTLEVNLRDVSAALTPTVGMAICKNGKTTYKDCSTVRALGHCYGAVCNIVLAEHDITEVGDSGGPWYYGNVAYGIHWGVKADPIWPFLRSGFSRAGRLYNASSHIIATN
ncbi:MAG: hypothetical protein GXY44_15280 [Phycisphaerales bacterium]|nr:hypothetical protein [Phycisphaerales bacterium]